MTKRTYFQGSPITYSIDGQGPTLLLLHGFCEDKRIWDAYKKIFLEHNYRVICIDLPGFGASGLLPGSASITAMAEAVYQVTLATALADEKFVLIGHSMGGYVSLAYARKYGQYLKGLGLFHSHPFADSAEKRQTRQKSIDFIRKYGHEKYLAGFFTPLFSVRFARDHPEVLQMLTEKAYLYRPQGIIAALEAMMHRQDQSDVLSSLAIPVLFIIGREDGTISFQKSMEQTPLPHVASIHLLEEVGHMGFLEAPEKTQEIILEFLALCGA